MAINSLVAIFLSRTDIEKPGNILPAHPIPAIYQIKTSFEQKKTGILKEFRIVR